MTEPALFDLDELTPQILEDRALTPYGRHHGLGPGVFGGRCCDQALYGSIESSGHRVWIYHLCSRTGEHETHKCDRCDQTWPAHPTPNDRTPNP